MATVIEEFVARLGWDVDDRDLKNFQKSVTGLKQTFSNVRYHVRNVLFGAGGLAYGFGRLMKSFSMFEDAEAAFTPMVGGAERAAEMVEKLNQAAANTPYQFGPLADVATQLLTTLNGDIDESISRMMMLGDTARGETDKLTRVTLGYNKALLKQKVDMESLNMINEAGVPILSELSKMYGKSTAQVFKMVTAGKVKTDDLTQAFRNMTSEGGMFYKGMETASVTLSGRISTFRDNINIAAAGLGKAFAPAMKVAVISMTDLAKQAAAWAQANEGLIRSKFRDFLKDTKELLKDIRDFGADVYMYIDRMGGLSNTFKLLAIAVGAVKLAPFLIALSGIIKAAPTAGAALKGMAVAAAPLLGVGLALAAAALAVDDIATTLRGGDSLGLRFDEYLGISDAMNKFSQFTAELLGFDFGATMQKFVGVTGGDWTEMFLVPIRTIGDMIHNYIVVPLYTMAFAVPDAMYQGFQTIYVLIQKMLSAVGIKLPEIDRRLLSEQMPWRQVPVDIGRNFASKQKSNVLPPKPVSKQSSGSQMSFPWTPVQMQTIVNAHTNADPNKIAQQSAAANRMMLERALRSSGGD